MEWGEMVVQDEVMAWGDVNRGHGSLHTLKAGRCPDVHSPHWAQPKCWAVPDLGGVWAAGGSWES